ncbi:MAG: Transcriptional regulator, TraR/DksA family [Candidatus Amesbacteria bacterium GW2011_GWA1_47_16]|uniref:Zinc finger DksA/TraR C4-type domain-containing protein n=5 Tax=Candidatus Amesiibacteriota TaxID=1752730 RepID=A0A1F4ZYG1_9BACT|nr:MAG: Transcriptional regulator, TraR/DksA family [Candidatus Amesbacteria bacterium GW2011_GWA1_47_16]KKU63072.1 MAG: hypothetical protein UX86_C0035G0013 [Candidatus Amesbacteria bacterium GW2011_GWC1_47_15]KKU97080.1 MAG: Transcriptional regulator, TraR/DksA family [Candidatus Amesbacteria bacterium GW2011_GWB1_48_13]OGD00019.1 MAG: hypothetical protein A2701_00170 [Candidatus Amesbacteria bacterium RIFCSPHIGHO2_01_FULL_47_34]OGD01584.1 MAG: hypothetical protein A2972_00370 [Candidatus Ame
MAKTKKDNLKKKNVLQYPAEVLEPVREYLSSRLSGLERRKKDLLEGDPYNNKARLDDNAAADTDAAEEVGHLEASAFRQTLDRSIIQIRKALSRIKFGKYGVCERCGKMIDTDRLMVMPETTVCVDCERKREK